MLQINMLTLTNNNRGLGTSAAASSNLIAPSVDVMQDLHQMLRKLYPGDPPAEFQSAEQFLACLNVMSGHTDLLIVLPVNNWVTSHQITP